MRKQCRPWAYLDEEAPAELCSLADGCGKAHGLSNISPPIAAAKLAALDDGTGHRRDQLDGSGAGRQAAQISQNRFLGNVQQAAMKRIIEVEAPQRHALSLGGSFEIIKALGRPGHGDRGRAVERRDLDASNVLNQTL